MYSLLTKYNLFSCFSPRQPTRDCHAPLLSNQVEGEDNEGEIMTTGRLEHENGDDRERTKGHQWDKDKDIGE